MTHPLLLLLLFPAGTRAFNPRRTYSWGRSSVTVNFYDFHLPICLHASFSVVFRDIDFTEILIFFSQCIWNHLLHLSSTAQISTTIVITTHYIEEVCLTYNNFPKILIRRGLGSERSLQGPPPLPG